MKISRLLPAFLTALLLPALAHAQGDGRKAYVRVSLQGSNSSGISDYQIYTSDEANTAIILADDPGTSPISISQTMLVKPGKQYGIHLTSSATGSEPPTGYVSAFDISIQAPPGFTVFVGTSNNAAPSLASPKLNVSGATLSSSGSTYTYYFQIVDDQALSIAPAGRITRIDVGDFVFQLGLGSLDNGRSAGRLEVRSDGKPTSSTYGWPTSAFDYHNLVITAPGSAGLGWVNVSSGVDNLETGQVKVVRSYVSSTSYTINFYAGDGTGSGYNSTAYASYTIAKITSGFPANYPSSADCMAITETQGSSTIYHYVFRSTASDIWTLIEGTSTDERIEEHSSSGTNPRTETILVKNSSAVTVGKTVRTWTPNFGSEVLTEEDGYSNVSGSADLISTFAYGTSGNGTTGKVTSVTRPDGSTVSYTYYDDDARLGQVKTVTEPWGASSTKVTTYDYTGPTILLKEYVLSAETTIGGTTTAKTTHSYDFTTSSADSRPLVRDTVTSYALSSSTLTSYNVSYMKEDADYVYAGRPYAIQYPDGRQQSFRYEKGTYSGGTFTAGSGSAWRTWIVEGSHTGGTSTTSIQSLTFEAIGLVANQSTLTEIVRNGDDTIAYQKTYVWDGSAWDTSTPISSTSNSWTDSVRQSSSTALNGVSQSWSWNGGLLSTATDGTGIVQSYTYDSLNRVSTVTKAGVASYDSLPSQYDQVLTYGYNALNLVISETHAGNSLTRTTTHTYDDAGRPKSTTLPDGEYTSMAYSFPGSYVTQVVTTNPDGGTVTAQSYASGQTKSVTGTTDVDRYFSYTVESDGEITTRVDLASSSSSRYKKVKTDWLGRTTLVTQPAYTGLSDNTVTNTYDGTTGLLTKIARTGLADEYRTYGYMGQLTVAGLDVGNNGSLSTSDAADRVTDYSDSGFVKISSDWWALAEQKIYPSASSPTTALVINKNYTRLTGWSSGLVAEASQVDRFGNTIDVSTTLDTTKKRVTVSTTYPGVSSAATTITNNGLSTKSTTPDGRSATITYDGLGRVYTSVDSRTGTTTYTYKTNGSYNLDQINTVTDPASAVTTYGYDASGRVNSLQNANGDYAYTTYDTSGRVTYRWGGAALPVHYTYNSYGQVSEQDTYRSGSLSTWSASTWPSGQTADATTFTYDGPTGLLTQKKDATNNSVDYAYNQQGQVYTRQWARTVSGTRVQTTYSYASLTGELTGLTYNDGTPNVTYGYDRMGLVTSAQDIYNGSSTDTRYFEYDSYQRLITEKNPGYQGSRWITYTYESGSGGTVLGRASGYTLGVSGSLAQDLTALYAYDSAGRIGSLQATHYGVSARTFTYSYGSGSSLVTGLSESSTGYSQTRAYESNRDLLNQMTTQFSSTTKSRYDYTFNTLGQRVTAKQSGDAFSDLYDGTNTATYYRYAYDSRGQLTSSICYLGNTVTSTSLPMPGRNSQFTYDAAGNRTSATCTTNSSLLDLFTSNSLNQYTARDNHSLTVSGTLDPNANILVNGSLAGRQGHYWSGDAVLSNSSGPAGAAIPLKVGKAGSPDLKQITSVPGVIPASSESLSYDADGNLSSDGLWTYTWDAENRLVAMENTSSAKTAASNAALYGKKLEFRYDSLGRRTSKKVSNWVSGAWSASSETRFVYQGWNLIAELDTSGNRIRTYAWGLDIAGSLTATAGIGAMVQFVDNTGTATAYLPGYDATGNLTCLMKSDGAIVAAYEYGPFGEAHRKDGVYAVANPLRSATKYYDDESGYAYYGTRYYDSRNGRFINRDTIGEAGGLNLYAFIGNNPTNSFDVCGQDDFMLIIGNAGGWFSWGTSADDRREEIAMSMYPSWMDWAGSAASIAEWQAGHTAVYNLLHGSDAQKDAAQAYLGVTLANAGSNTASNSNTNAGTTGRVTPAGGSFTSNVTINANSDNQTPSVSVFDEAENAAKYAAAGLPMSYGHAGDPMVLGYQQTISGDWAPWSTPNDAGYERNYTSSGASSATPAVAVTPASHSTGPIQKIAEGTTLALTVEGAAEHATKLVLQTRTTTGAKAGSRILAFLELKWVRALGPVGLFLGTAVDVYKLATHQDLSKTHASVNFVVGVGGWLGGPEVGIPADIYALVDSLYPGGWAGNAEGKGLIWDSVEIQVKMEQANPYRHPGGGL